VTLKSVQWQPQPRTYKYRLRVESDGLGWHSRAFADDFDLCASPDGNFVTLFHTKKDELLEKIAKAFFHRQWSKINPDTFRSLTVSRFLAATIVAEVVQRAFRSSDLIHYPRARLVGGFSPMFASGSGLWIGYRFFSEDAYSWARRGVDNTSRVIALYFADTKYQFRTDLPPGVDVRSIAEFDATRLGGEYEEFKRPGRRLGRPPARLRGRGHHPTRRSARTYG
jgi:hypothetical protein